MERSSTWWPRASDDCLDRLRRRRLHRTVHRRPFAGQSVHARRLPDHAGSTTRRGPDLQAATGLAALLPLPDTERSRPALRRAARQPLLVDEFLTWSWDAGDAYVLGLYRGVRGVYRITMGPGSVCRCPKLVDRTDAAHDRATVTGRRRPDPLAGRRVLVRPGGRTSPAHVAAGAPRPTGPLLWSARRPSVPRGRRREGRRGGRGT